MKVLLLAGATFGFSSAAFAADMPVKAPVIPQAVYNWTGFYVGVNAGYGGGMKDWSGSTFPPAALSVAGRSASIGRSAISSSASKPRRFPA